MAFVLFAAAILGYGAGFAWYMLDRFDLFNMVRDGYYDDAFYYLQIAYHMAEGRFSTFDGGLTRTNGYHPLWLFLITPVYWLFDKTEALFAIKAFEMMLVAGGVALIAVAARAARLAWILLFAAAPLLYQLGGVVRGMETALVLFLLGLLMLAACLFARNPARWRWPLAAVVFALPWARLECAAVALAALAALCFLEWSGRLPGALSCDGQAPRAPPLRDPEPAERESSANPPSHVRPWRLQAALPLASAFASILVYFAYNGVVFGGIVPVSGALKVYWSQVMWDQEGGYDLAENFRAIARLEFFDDELLIALEVCVYALLVWWLSRRFRRQEGELLLAFMVGVLGLAAGHLAKFAHNVLFIHPFEAFTDWWYAPAYLMGTLVIPVRCFVGIYVLRCVLGERLPRTSEVLCLAGIVVAGWAQLAKVDFAVPFRWVDAQREWRSPVFMARSFMGAAVMNRLLPKDAVVGSWDSGVVGYFTSVPVMNLDGLANSYAYKRAWEEDGYGNRIGAVVAPFDGRVAEFLKPHGLSHYANVFNTYGEIPSVWGSLPVFETHASGFFPGATGMGAEVFRVYGDSRQRERFWDWIAPHLDRQGDDTGLLVQGRVAQAFARECAANEMAAWTFGQGEQAVGTWMRTPDGSCVTAIVLREQSDSVRVRRETVASRVGGRAPAIQADAMHPSAFDVYLVGRRLVYVKEKCEQSHAATPFFLHVVPARLDPNEDGKSVDFNTLDFNFEDYGGWSPKGEGLCIAEVPLPDYAVAEVRTGQYRDDGRVWGGKITMSTFTFSVAADAFTMKR